MTDYSHIVPDRIFLDRNPRDGAAHEWDEVALLIDLSGMNVEVKSTEVTQNGMRTHEESQNIDLRIPFANSQLSRQSIDVAKLKKDMSEGSVLAVLIDRVIAGHGTEITRGIFRGTFTDDAEEALRDLEVALGGTGHDESPYLDLEWCVGLDE